MEGCGGGREGGGDTPVGRDGGGSWGGGEGGRNGAGDDGGDGEVGDEGAEERVDSCDAGSPAHVGLFVRPRALRAATWRDTWGAHMAGALEGDARAASGGRGRGSCGSEASQHEKGQQVHMQAMWSRVRRGGAWWWREESAPARSAQWVRELDQDAPMQQWIDSTDGIGELQQPEQHARAHGEMRQAHTFGAGGSRDCKAQGGSRSASGAGWGEEDACAARDVAGSPGVVRARVHPPSVQTGIEASQRSSQSAETNETILRDGQGVYQARGWRERGFRRAVSGVSGALRTTREAAGATVRRAKRLFFRDEG